MPIPEEGPPSRECREGSVPGAGGTPERGEVPCGTCPSGPCNSVGRHAPDGRSWGEEHGRQHVANQDVSEGERSPGASYGEQGEPAGKPSLDGPERAEGAKR